MAKWSLKQTLYRLFLLIRSGYPVIYVVSHEEDRVLRYLLRLMAVLKTEDPQKNLFSWDASQTQKIHNPVLAYGDVNAAEQMDWLAVPCVEAALLGAQHQAGLAIDSALTNVAIATPASDQIRADSLTVFFDLHPYLVDNGTMVRPLRNAAKLLRRYYTDMRNAGDGPGAIHTYKTIVIVAPSAARLSPELERDIICVDFPLPEVDELRDELKSLIAAGAVSYPGKLDSEEMKRVCGAADETRYKQSLEDLIAGAGRGLSLEDYRLGLNGFAVRGEGLSSKHINDMLDLKAKSISSPALNYTPKVEIQLGGLDKAKQWLETRKEPVSGETVRQQYHLPAPKGILLCGVSGGGKSQLAKLAASVFNLALLRLDIGALFGPYVGVSEERTREAINLAGVLAPVVLWLDEIDKAFSAMGNAGDSGVSERVFGTLLTWLSEKDESVFVVATANDFRQLLGKFPEFGRKGRFDEIFWVDLPNEDAKKAIFEIYLRPLAENGYLYLDDMNQHGASVSADGDALELLCGMLSQNIYSQNLTGAEIEHAVNNALYTAYDNARVHGGSAHLTVEVLIDAVREAMSRALYAPNGGHDDVRSALLAEARDRNWIFT